MDKHRKKNAYLILVLLIFVVVAIIGGLVATLFNITPPTPPQQIYTPELKTNVVEHITPISETYIEVEPKEIAKPREQDHQFSTAVVPAICEGYGAQIKQRDAYKNPVTYSAQIQPNHVNFMIYTDKKLNSKGSN